MTRRALLCIFLVASACSVIGIRGQSPPSIRVRFGGGQYTDSQGNVWSSNLGWNGVAGTNSTSHAISGTSDPALYQSWVYGPAQGTNPPMMFTYSLPNGTYTLTLKDAENGASSAGQRVFNVVVNGQVIITGLDIYAAAGGLWIAHDFSAPVTVTTGQVSIQLVPQVPYNAKLSALSLIPVGGPPPPPSNQPNLVIVQLDDANYSQLMRDQYLPMTDDLIRGETLKFLNYYVVTPQCCPSRAQLLRGLYAHAFEGGMPFQSYGPGQGAPAFNDSSTIAVWLKGAGYKTGLYGKYLNSYYLLNGGQYVPPGWSDWHAFVGNPVPGGWADNNFYYGYGSNDNGVVSLHGSSPADYGTDWAFATAINYIQQNPSGPLFLYVNPPAPHDPFTPAPGDQPCGCLPPNRPPNFNLPPVGAPSWLTALGLLSPATISANDAVRQNYNATLAAVDRDIVSLISSLQASGRWSNTILNITSDNGLFFGEHALGDTKDAPYPEDTHMPLWVRKPGMPPGTTATLASNIDIAPTLASLAGITPQARVNGVSLLPLLTGGSITRSSILMEELGTLQGQKGTLFSTLFDGQWWYTETPSGNELYDTVNDPFFLVNRVSDSVLAGRVSTMAAQLAAMRTQ